MVKEKIHTNHLMVFFFNSIPALRLAMLACIFSLITSCASGPLKNARKAFYGGQPDKAVEILSGTKQFSKQNMLLFYMEKGLILHELGQYQESIDQLRQASNLIEKQETISAGRQTASLVTTEWLTAYKGEFSERLWVHTYLMMNYLLINKYDDALVEAKQALSVLDKYPKPLANDYFSRALIGLCYENVFEINDAYIEYKKLASLLPDLSPVALKLYDFAKRLNFADEADQYLQFITENGLRLQDPSQTAELVLFIAMGRAPKKKPGNIVLPPSIRFSFPQYPDCKNRRAIAEIFESTERLPSVLIGTDICGVSKASLKERATKIIVKETARAAGKETIANNIDDPLVEVLVRVVLFVMEEPDTRCWQTLPGQLALTRVSLNPGKHDIKVVISDSIGGIIDTILLPELTVSTGDRVFHSIRINN